MAKLGYRIEPETAAKLLAAIFEQAISDLKVFQKQGVIVAGRFVPRDDLKGSAVASAKDLIHFFQPGGMAEKTLLSLNMNTSFIHVRRALNLEPLPA